MDLRRHFRRRKLYNFQLISILFHQIIACVPQIHRTKHANSAFLADCGPNMPRKITRLDIFLSLHRGSFAACSNFAGSHTAKFFPLLEQPDRFVIKKPSLKIVQRDFGETFPGPVEIWNFQNFPGRL
jgi:hypothetical protein